MNRKTRGGAATPPERAGLARAASARGSRNAGCDFTRGTLPDSLSVRHRRARAPSGPWAPSWRPYRWGPTMTDLPDEEQLLRHFEWNRELLREIAAMFV